MSAGRSKKSDKGLDKCSGGQSTEPTQKAATGERRGHSKTKRTKVQNTRSRSRRQVDSDKDEFLSSNENKNISSKIDLKDSNTTASKKKIQKCIEDFENIVCPMEKSKCPKNLEDSQSSEEENEGYTTPLNYSDFEDYRYDGKEYTEDEESEMEEEEEGNERYGTKGDFKLGGQRSCPNTDSSKFKNIKSVHNYFRYYCIHLLSQSKTIYFNTLYYNNNPRTHLTGLVKFPLNSSKKKFSPEFSSAMRDLKFEGKPLSSDDDDKHADMHDLMAFSDLDGIASYSDEETLDRWEDITGSRSNEEMDCMEQVAFSNLKSNLGYNEVVSICQNDVYRHFDSKMGKFPNNNLKEGVDAYWNGIQFLEDLGPAIKSWDVMEEEILPTSNMKPVYDMALFPGKSLFLVCNRMLISYYLKLLTFLLNKDRKSTIRKISMGSRRTTKFSVQNYQFSKKSGVGVSQKKKSSSSLSSNRRKHESPTTQDISDEEFGEPKQKPKLNKNETEIEGGFIAEDVNSNNDDEIAGNNSQEDYFLDPNPKNKQKRPQKNEEEVLIERDENGQVILPIFIGTICLISLGRIIHDQEKYHTRRYIFPVGYKSKRLYFSLVEPNRRCWYTQEILNNEDANEPLFRLTCEDSQSSSIEGPTASGVWSEVLEKVRPEREKIAGRRIYSTVSGPEQFGLSHPVIHKLIEELPGADMCVNYDSKLFVQDLKESKKKKNKK